MIPINAKVRIANITRVPMKKGAIIKIVFEEEPPADPNEDIAFFVAEAWEDSEAAKFAATVPDNVYLDWVFSLSGRQWNSTVYNQVKIHKIPEAAFFEQPMPEFPGEDEEIPF